jgi:CDP-diacylglycerol--glycerol-3-phosphate 3-phosphatidyltransferase
LSGKGIHRRIPNLITFLRFALLPLASWTFLDGDRPATLALIALIAFSDWLDGFLARRWDVATPLGALLDPIADKLAQITLLGLLAWGGRPEFGTVPPWFFGVVLARELFLIYGAVRVRTHLGRVEIKARWQGKLSTLLVFVIILGALARIPQPAIDVLTWVTTPVVVAAAWRYWRAGMDQVR